MKKYLFIIIVIALFAGCAKKNDPTPIPVAPKPILTGKWYLTTDTVTQYNNGVQTHQDAYADDHTAYLQFNSDGSGMEALDGGTSVLATATFTYTFTSSTGQIVFNFPTQTVNGTSRPAHSATATVKSFGVNDLVLTFQSIQITGTTTLIIDEVSYLIKS